MPKCRRSDLAAGAYVSDERTGRLFEVKDAGQRVVSLTDVRSPIDDPTVIGMLTTYALMRLKLVRPAPCVDDIATAAEFGPLATAPE